MTRRLSQVCLLAFALFAGAAQAGTVYVPLPGLTQAGSAAYEAEVTVTNSAAQTASVTLEGTPNVTKMMTLKAGDRFLVDMGFPEGAVPDEVPSFGWTYSDVVVEAYK